jgi:importin subunit alpha-1
MAARRGRTGRDPTGTTAKHSGRVAANTNSISDVGKALLDPQQGIQQQAARAVRELLSEKHNPPIQQVIDAGMVPRLIELLTKSKLPTLQFEAAWALTNIVSGSSEHVEVCVKEGIVPKMTQLLDSPNDDVREQAIWALGNIAGDSVKMRDKVLKHNALTPLLHLLDSNTTLISMLRNATWTLSNLCRGKPQPPFALVKPALPTLAHLVHSNDEDVLADACWALSCLSDGSNEKIQAVIDAGVCPRLVELLMNQSAKVQTSALRTVGNIVTGEEAQTQIIIDSGALPCLATLLSNDRKGIRKEACWALSNITAGSKEQLQAVIDHNIIPALAHMLETEDVDIRKECAWAISNATSSDDDVQIKFLVDHGCVPILVNLLDKPDVRLVSVALEGIENILKCGQRNQHVDGTNPFVAAVKMCGGVNKIENLQRHEKHKIYATAVMILENYIEASVSFPRSCCRLCPLPCAPLCAEAACACSWAEKACACALSHLAVAAGCALPANEQ